VSFPYPPIADYGFISDCHSSALVSRAGSIDWCCMPRFDSPSVFGRILDWSIGGFWSIAPDGDWTSTRGYVEDSLVLETTFSTDGGRASVTDLFAMRVGGRLDPHLQLVRIVDGTDGVVPLRSVLAPRFDYGGIRPWIREEGEGLFAALGGSAALLIWSDAALRIDGSHDLVSEVAVGAGDRYRFSMQFRRPETLDAERPTPPAADDLDGRLGETLEWWRKWAAKSSATNVTARGALRSAVVLKGLTNAPTGAIAAAPTTSLPENPGGERNWDYRYSWVRDSSFALASLAELGYVAEADGFRRFIERSAAGSADELQIMYGLGGEHRLTEIELDLEGYRAARPVRIGNAAYCQVQLDVYGELLELAWRWHQRGHRPEESYWRFLVGLVDGASKVWEGPDRGIWEIRGEPRHFVHSKVMCWVALDRGIRLAESTGLAAPLPAWRDTRERIRGAVESHGYDRRRGVFVESFGSSHFDAALLLLPNVGFVAWDDERMVRTTDALVEELGRDGYLLRYRTDDGLAGGEGYFLCCSFWLVECLARQGRAGEATAVFERADAAANDLGLFSEEIGSNGGMLGNFPQGLTHLSHIEAALALADATTRR
jgi:GH15 family glucan-1,4-alpha-glucosidase